MAKKAVAKKTVKKESINDVSSIVDAVSPVVEKQRIITVDYFGRIGNQLFQYFFGKILENETGAKMITHPPEFFHEIIHEDYDYAQHIYDSCHHITDENFSQNLTPENRNEFMNCHGYFQCGQLFSLYKNMIKSMFKLPTIQKNTEDIVVHLRLTDYFWHRNKWVISPKWYIQQIRKEKYRNCYIVVEPHPTNKEYLRYFDGIKGIKIVTGNSAKDDFEFIRSFDRIICSNSTFCWWAAFLSEASKIYTFKPWIRDPKVTLQYIPNGIAVDGEFFRNKRLENLDWTDYWKK